jgi:hypothetical protein
VSAVGVRSASLVRRERRRYAKWSRVPFARPFVPYDLPATHVADGQLVLTVRPTRLADHRAWAETWRPVLRAPEAAWPWVEHVVRAGVEPERLCLAISRALPPGAGSLEALLSLTVAPSRLETSLLVAYIEYVGKKPPVGRADLSPKLGGVLVVEAMCVSRDNGYHGRVGLHSKGGGLDGWYERLGFTPIEYEDTEDGRMLYFECTDESARKILEGKLEP